MSFDTIVANAGRLTILTALAVEERQEFVTLRKRTKLTDGNLASHARRLASAGMVEIDKQLRDGKPVTTLTLTSTGRGALELHVRRLMSALTHRRVGPTDQESTKTELQFPATPLPAKATRSQDDWVD
jgi:DNA-binding MarR family transcriptional regulator